MVESQFVLECPFCGEKFFGVTYLEAELKLHSHIKEKHSKKVL